jgi:hypothetical protein
MPRRVPLEERLRHLRPTGVVVTDKEDVLHPAPPFPWPDVRCAAGEEVVYAADAEIYGPFGLFEDATIGRSAHCGAAAGPVRL